jgi:hypothetical protein
VKKIVWISEALNELSVSEGGLAIIEYERQEQTSSSISNRVKPPYLGSASRFSVVGAVGDVEAMLTSWS